MPVIHLYIVPRSTDEPNTFVSFVLSPLIIPCSICWGTFLESGDKNLTWTFLKHGSGDLASTLWVSTRCMLYIVRHFGRSGPSTNKNTFPHFPCICRSTLRIYETERSTCHPSLLPVCTYTE